MNNAVSSSSFEKVKSEEEKVSQMAAKVPDDGTLGKYSTTEGPATFFGSTRY